jgi:hypothetical protein
MAVLGYRKYILVSRPHLDQHLGLWIPYASAYWQGAGPMQFHRFSDLARTFLTEEEAEAFGFGIARAWVDEQNPEP